VSSAFRAERERKKREKRKDEKDDMMFFIFASSHPPPFRALLPLLFPHSFFLRFRETEPAKKSARRMKRSLRVPSLSIFPAFVGRAAKQHKAMITAERQKKLR
jgi:hypothetical protein